MCEGIKLGAGSSGKIANGIIQQYKTSGAEIKPKTFIDFVNESNGFYLTGTSAYVGGICYSGMAVEINSTQALLVFRYSSYYMYAVVVTFNGSTVTCGTATMVMSATSSAYYANAAIFSHDVTKLSDGSFLLAYRSYNLASSKVIHFVKIAVSGTSITRTYLGSFSVTVDGPVRLVALSGARVCVVYCNATNSYIYARVGTVGASSVSWGTAVSLSSTANTAKSLGAALAAENKVLTCDATGTMRLLNISNTTITVGATNNELYNSGLYDGFLLTAAGGVIAGAAFTQSNAFVANITVANDNITIKEKIPLRGFVASSIYNTNWIWLFKVTDTILYAAYDTDVWRIDIVGDTLNVSLSHSVKGTSMTVTNVICGGLSSGYIIGMAETTSEDMPVQIYNAKKLNTYIVESNSQILGVTKTKATANSHGKVWVLG